MTYDDNRQHYAPVFYLGFGFCEKCGKPRSLFSRVCGACEKARRRKQERVMRVRVAQRRRGCPEIA
mgnify:CR=1 FL=1